MASNILFLKLGGFSNINDAVLNILESEFPESQVETIDAWQLLKKEISVSELLKNVFYFFTEYGLDLFLFKKKWSEWSQWFFATSYLSIMISDKIKKTTRGKEYRFTFQTQSIFNGKIDNIPHYVYTDHTTRTNLLYPSIDPKSFMRSKRFIKRVETKLYQEATMIFTFGSLAAHSLTTQYLIPEEKILVVYSGSNAHSQTNFNAQKYCAKNILFIGIDWERKGGPTLLKVFKKVLANHPDASLTIVGCNPPKFHLPNCEVVGKIPVADIAKYYEAASIFCLPTLREPFGVVFVEAMSFRLPIVANNIGSIPELVVNDRNGYLINNDVDGYAHAICSLIEDPTKSMKMGEAGYQLSQTIFQWKNVGNLIKENISKSLIEIQPLGADANLWTSENGDQFQVNGN